MFSCCCKLVAREKVAKSADRFGDVFFVQRELFPLPLLSFTLPHIPLSFAYTSEDLVKRPRTINPQA